MTDEEFVQEVKRLIKEEERKIELYRGKDGHNDFSLQLLHESILKKLKEWIGE